MFQWGLFSGELPLDGGLMAGIDTANLAASLWMQVTRFRRL
jgi:hypothetical protein